MIILVAQNTVVENHGLRVITFHVSFAVEIAVKPTMVPWLTMVRPWSDHGPTMVAVPWFVYHGTAMMTT